MAPQKGDIGNAGPLASRLASLSAYLLRSNVPRMCIFKASQTPKSNNVWRWPGMPSSLCPSHCYFLACYSRQHL